MSHFDSPLEQLAAGQLPEVPAVGRLRALLSPEVPLETLASMAAAATRRHFGKTIRLFAPLYVSNECVNLCTYCGLSRERELVRTTLDIATIEREARYLEQHGFRSVLLVSGEHPRVDVDYLAAAIAAVRPRLPSVSIEVASQSEATYRALVDAGMEGVVLYQETYDPTVYFDIHRAGPKRKMLDRLSMPERAHDAGVRRIGLGVLLGLAPWQDDVLRLAAHVAWVERRCWRAFVTVSFPRLRPRSDGDAMAPAHVVTDEEYVRIVTAFRVVFPHIGIVLSTREPAWLRDGLVPLGPTHYSAGSDVRPGGYGGERPAGVAAYRSVAGRRLPLSEGDLHAGPQFSLEDRREPAVVADRLRELGFEPVWKDWDGALGGSSQPQMAGLGAGLEATS